jgi:amino acid adenylation domain-containing protein
MKQDESEIKELARKAAQGDPEALKKLRESGILKPASYPLSHAQRRLWTLCQFDGGSVGYNMPGAFCLEGQLDIKALEYAFSELIRRHESLRTAFVLVSGEPRQQIIPPQSVQSCVRFSDLSAETNPEQIAKELAYKDALMPFELEKGMLIRVSVLKTAEDRHIMLFNMHHIISDGWSVGIMIKELSFLYNAFRQGRDNPLSPLRIQYKDYAAWQKQFLESKDVEKHRNYWHRKLSGEIPVLNLPADFPRPSMQTFRGELISFQIDAEQTRSLRTLAYTHGASLFMVLLAIVKVLLYRYTAQTEIIVGIPAAGRNHADIEDQIGFYVNTLALRDILDETADFSFLLKQIVQTATDAYEHQAYPFDKLVEELNLRRDFSRSPLFDVMVAMQNAEEMKFHLTGVEITPFLQTSYISKFDLTFNFWENEESVRADIEYNTDLFSRDRIERTASHFRELTHSILTDISTPISRLNILSESEKHRLLIEFNDTAAEFPQSKTVAELFEEQAAKTPDNLAVVFEDIKLSYRQLNEQASQIARFLKDEFDIQPDERVGILLNRSAQLIIGITGVIKSGGAYVPIEASYPAKRINYILNDSSCRLLITDRKYKNFAASIGVDIPIIDIQSLPDAGKPLLKSLIRPDNLAYVIYTSGSTGEPKGVQISHRSLINLISWHTKAFNVRENSRATLYASIGFDASVWESWPYLLKGACLYPLVDDLRLDIDKMYHFLRDHRITHAFVPSPVCEAMTLENQDGMENLCLLTGGDLLRNVHPSKMSIINNYGPTETTVVATSCKVDPLKPGHIPIGRPIDNTQIYILDHDLHLLPIGVPGEICIGGAGLSGGYLNRPELTAEKFVPHPFSPGERLYRTGDLGRWLGDGNIEFLGRNDDQVKIRGYRIETAEIAKRLLNYPGVKDAIVIAKDFRKGYKELAAYIVSAESVDKKPDINEIRDYLREMLPDYMIPSYFVRLNQIPLTTHGKTDYRALPDPEKSGVSREENLAIPQTDTERRIADIWKQTLKIEQIGIRDNFFDLGGDSLLLIKVRSRLQDVFQKELSVVELFRYPTIQSLAAYLSRAEQTGDEQTQPRRHDKLRQQRQTRLKHRGKNDE